MQPPNVFPSTGASPVPGGTSAFSPYANPHPMTTTSQQVGSIALSSTLPSSEQRSADILLVANRYADHISTDRLPLKREAKALKETLRTLLGQGGTLDLSITAYDNAVTYALQNNYPEVRKELFPQFCAMAVLYEALNGLMLAQTTVLNRGQATSLGDYWDIVSALNEYLTTNRTALNALLSEDSIPRAISAAATQHAKRANRALERAGLTSHVPLKKELEDTDIPLQRSLPSLSSSVAVPLVQSQPVGTGQAQGTVPTAPVRTTIPSQQVAKPQVKSKKRLAEETGENDFV